MTTKSTDRNSLKKNQKTSKAGENLPQLISPSQTVMLETLQSGLEKIEKEVGGRVKLAEALLGSGDDQAKEFALEIMKQSAVNESLTSIANRLRLNPQKLAKAFTTGELTASVVRSFIKLSQGLPAVMDHAIESAKIRGVEGFKDRELLFKVAGLIEKSGPGVQINLQQNIGKEGTFEKVMGFSGSKGLDNPFIEVEVDV